MPPTSHRRTVVLIVEDDDDLRATLGDVIQDEGYSVLRARNGQEALACLASEAAIDLLVIDVMMPVMDGIQLRERLMSESGWRDVPRLFLTGKGQHAQQAALVAPDRVIRKPITIDELLAAVAEVARE
jgi:CheY-like chemotaxis protein